MTEHFLSCSAETAAQLIHDAIVNGSFSGECEANYTVSSHDGKCIVMVFEKHFMRNSSRASLTVTVDNLSGRTHMVAVGSGGGEGWLFSFDWGAAGSFEGSATRAVSEYICG